MRRFGTMAFLFMGLVVYIPLFCEQEPHECKECTKSVSCWHQIRDWYQQAADEEQSRVESVRRKAKERFTGIVTLIDENQDGPTLSESALRILRSHLNIQRKQITNLCIQAALINQQLVDKLGLRTLKDSQAASLFASGLLTPYLELDAEDLMLITSVGNLYWGAREAKLLAGRIAWRARKGKLNDVAKEKLHNEMTRLTTMLRTALHTIAMRVENLSRKGIYSKPHGIKPHGRQCFIGSPAIEKKG